jgi:hypothetical protein
MTDFGQVMKTAERWIPFAILTTLLVDWIRLRWQRSAEEKKQIARILPELLELRLTMLAIREFATRGPKLLAELMQPAIQEKIPPEVYPQVVAEFLPMMIGMFMPADDNFAARYRKTIEDIAGFRPLLAYKLRGKERYFDLRACLTQHFAKIPGSPVLAHEIATLLDDEFLPTLDETILGIAKAYGIKLHWEVKRFLRKPPPDMEPVLQNLLKKLHGAMREHLNDPAAPEACQKSPPIVAPSSEQLLQNPAKVDAPRGN